MAEREKEPPGGHDVSGSGDRYEALLEVLDHQTAQAKQDRARELAELRRAKEERRTPYWLLGVLLLVAVWLWLFPPGFLRVEPPPAQPIAQEEAALRFAMYAQAQRIEAFHAETGRYPSLLDEAGPPLPAMEYRRLSDELYQLTGRTERLTLTYRSDLPLEEFVEPGAGVPDAAADEAAPDGAADEAAPDGAARQAP